MYTIKKNQNRFTTLFTVLLVLFLMRFFFSFFYLIEAFSPLTIALICVYGVISLALILGVVKSSRSKLVLNEDGLIYTPPFGAVRNLSYKDLEKISMGGKDYVLYTKDGKKLTSFNDFRTENASSIVAFLKAKGVKAEI